MRDIGARQRRQHPGGGPAGDSSFTHGRQAFLRHARQQPQTPIDPADIPAAATGDLQLRQTVGIHKLLQQQRLFDRVEGARVSMRQRLQNAVRHRALPDPDLHSVSTQTLQRSHASVALDQHPALRLIPGLPVRYDYARHELSTLLDGARQMFYGARLLQPRLCKPQLQAVQINFQHVINCRDHGKAR